MAVASGSEPVLLGEDWDHQTFHQDLLLQTLQSLKQSIAEVENLVVAVVGMLVVAEGVAEVVVAALAAVWVAAWAAVWAAAWAAAWAAVLAVVLAEHFLG